MGLAPSPNLPCFANDSTRGPPGTPEDPRVPCTPEILPAGDPASGMGWGGVDRQLAKLDARTKLPKDKSAPSEKSQDFSDKHRVSSEEATRVQTQGLEPGGDRRGEIAGKTEQPPACQL